MRCLRRHVRSYFLVTFLLLLIFYLIHHFQKPHPPISNHITSCPLTIALILCHAEATDNRTSSSSTATSFNRQLNQTLVLLKSLALQQLALQGSSSSYCANIFILASTRGHFDLLVKRVQQEIPHSHPLFNFSYIPVQYPQGVDEGMASWFRPCATLRLFLPHLIPPHVKSLLYLDTDFIFLQNPLGLMEWVEESGEESFASTKLGAMAPCLFHYRSPANQIPYYGGSGLNAGLMVMNLQRMREKGWTAKVLLIANMYASKIRLADQDILNIFFHFFPEELVQIGCGWNFRPFQCRPGSHCNSSSGIISAIHGNALSFTDSGPEPLFATVFAAFSSLTLPLDLDPSGGVSLWVEEWLQGLEMSLIATEEKFPSSHCAMYGEFSTSVIQTLRQSLLGNYKPLEDNM